ncbi:hypothetical protein [Aeromicrobium sp.]|uniref:hypothetical protein n=1 Tax=Aeromicrobium sp. TaxID=1871063 RepID=UPI003519D384
MSRQFLAGILVGCVSTTMAVAIAATWMSRGDLAQRCLEAAPSDLEVSQASLAYDADHLKAALTCTWSGEGGRGPSRTITIPLYR